MSESDYSKEKLVKKYLRRLMKADHLVETRYADGELSIVAMAKLRRQIALAIDRVVLEAAKSKKLAEAVSPVLREGVKRGSSICMHYLLMMELGHRGEKEDGLSRMVRTANKVKKKMGLEDIDGRWAELKEEAKEWAERKEDNKMFG